MIGMRPRCGWSRTVAPLRVLLQQLRRPEPIARSSKVERVTLLIQEFRTHATAGAKHALSARAPSWSACRAGDLTKTRHTTVV
jgi:hypothetical protein